jgi:uncharacterized protein with HEPN domain
MKRPRNTRIVIDEMLDHIGYILEKLQDLSEAEFHENRDIRQSVERSLEIISEATRHLPQEITQQHPEIPWRQVADFGNVLRHSYFAMKRERVWNIVTDELGSLRDALISLRNEMG